MSKFLRTLSVCLVGACIILIQACSTDSSVVDTKSTSNNDGLAQKRSELAAKGGVELADKIMNSGKAGATIQDATFNATLCPGSTVSGEWGGTYNFYAVAGSTVTLDVDRTGCGMDPAFDVYGSQDGSNWLGWADDTQWPASGCGCFGDPYMSFEAPYTGWYMVSVWNFLGCGEGGGFNITATGTVCNIVIDGCDSGVFNQELESGGSMMEAILACAANATNHGDFVSCVSHLTNTWKTAGLISGAQKGAIQDCAANSSWPL